MSKNQRIKEIEKLLEELKAQDEIAVTLESVQPRSSGFGQSGTLFKSIWKRKMLWFITALIVLVVSVPFITLWAIKGSTFTENKGAFLVRIQAINELATAEAYTKAIIKRQDNKIFGQEIGLDLLGTKRQLLVVIPGSVKAGIDFSKVEAEDIVLDEEAKTATLTLPKAEFLGGPEMFFDQVEVFSAEGLLREKPDIAEGYELATEAKEMIMKETKEQGVLQLAEENAARSVSEMFSLVGYDVTVEFEE
ncbi:DUF4230 domain-containing protein [Paenisporosarcina quisquiliarum]|uniref:DUF4230 domain-containing protein n=1 Tax=Paenisporosarcina quisquiliarum TaxID=365346 RepID=A0A9X3RE04_9BACL|nr:DUF4230 domain-containing protein [Paenisporosarcina quisquiliarum]MCZ8538096.1 DUF4230 domain-containing protein [Paenisporosarcina quisquiliarum]